MSYCSLADKPQPESEDASLQPSSPSIRIPDNPYGLPPSDGLTTALHVHIVIAQLVSLDKVLMFKHATRLGAQIGGGFTKSSPFKARSREKLYELRPILCIVGPQ